ncbi:MAG: winged helix DNA-binding domain-containing protein [Actinomycetota bacterium]|nr:winged helix DNA-binding domain-containing protein [Actinomycetota bacterium]
MVADVLTDRALSRATLERQLLLGRARAGVVDAVARVVGLQAQAPQAPYVGLWSRLERFTPEQLGDRLLDRSLVRIVLMRARVHLVSADDCLGLRPLVQPVLDAELARHRDHGPALAGIDLGPVVDHARTLLETTPLTSGELGAALAGRFGEAAPAALAYACRNHLALVQVPPRGLWRRSGPARTTTAESWIGRTQDRDASIDELVLRYLGAFGPATPADIGAWSRLTGFREVVDRLRPKLRTFRDERGRELVDLPHALRPDPDTTAPVRFLPRYDNVLLSHADRRRFVDDADRRRLAAVARSSGGSVLADGRLVGVWTTERDEDGEACTLVVDHLARVRRRTRAAIEQEGAALLTFTDHDRPERDVRLVPLT